MLKKLLSYFVPVVIHRKKSAVSKDLKLAGTTANSCWILPTPITLMAACSASCARAQNIGFDKIKAMQSVLVLGVAGGSVIKTLVDEIKYGGKITGVEIDPEVIQLANKYFSLDQIPNLKIVIGDAFEFVLKTHEKYDLIIIDIFRTLPCPTFV
jgi:protein-L-isoaspartate O-methyltransferase